MIRKAWRGNSKHCARCDQWRSSEMFHRNKRNWDGRHAYCKACMADGARLRYQRERTRLLRLGREYRAAHPLKRKDTALRSRFGITLADFDALMVAQHGLCAICGGEGRLNVDHCHTTGAVRGLLCTPCNTAIGALRDDPERIRKAAAYVEAAR